MANSLTVEKMFEIVEKFLLVVDVRILGSHGGVFLKGLEVLHRFCTCYSNSFAVEKCRVFNR